MKRFVMGALVGLSLTAAVAAESPAKTTPGQVVGNNLVQAFQGAAQSAQSRPEAAFHGHTVNSRARFEMGRTAPAPPPGTGRQITVRAYAYCLRGFTARGTAVQYGTVAVDPRVIPLGSKLYVPGYGWARALDTGGAIQGNTIDLWMPTLGQCYQWGTRTITITVLPK